MQTNFFEPAIPVESSEWAYVAGILDGEGSIQIITKGGARFGLSSVAVVMCEKELIEWLRDRFGGGWVKPRRLKSGKLAYRVAWTGKKATNFILRGALPYLRAKKLRAQLALSLNELVAKQGNGIGYSLPEDVVKKRLDICDAMRATFN